MGRRRGWQGMHWIRDDKRLAIYLRDGHACAYCAKHLLGQKRITLDHVIPRTLGGTNSAMNLVCCCDPCNVDKGEQSLDAWSRHLRSLGVDTDAMWLRIRKRTGEVLDGWRRQAKRILAGCDGSGSEAERRAPAAGLEPACASEGVALRHNDNLAPLDAVGQGGCK